MSCKTHDRDLWSSLKEAEANLYRARGEFLAQDQQTIIQILQDALERPADRGIALRLLQLLDEGIRITFFPMLVELGSVGHSDVGLVREVLLSLPRYWVDVNLKDQIWPILEDGGAEEYRRLAELLQILRSDLIDDLVERAREHPDEDVREVAEDFAN